MVAFVIAFALVGIASAADSAACMKSCPQLEKLGDDPAMEDVCKAVSCLKGEADNCADIIDMMMASPEAAMIECACKCPALATLGDNPPMDKVCSAMSCLASNSKECKAVSDMMAKSPEAASMGCMCACPAAQQVEKDCEDLKDKKDDECDIDIAKGNCAATVNTALTCIDSNAKCTAMSKMMKNDKGTQACATAAADKVAADAASDGAQGLGLMGATAALAFTVLA